ncbi:hypothetical protein [Nocardia brevicatena]|uniref:hypothetical protein n=1 Tax=Nocardia brevicatena TaxID=37327 RepID=UPI0012F8AA1E|nr:hypothetical protein [Nocardia brevicatena]
MTTASTPENRRNFSLDEGYVVDLEIDYRGEGVLDTEVQDAEQRNTPISMVFARNYRALSGPIGARLFGRARTRGQSSASAAAKQRGGQASSGGMPRGGTAVS